MITVSAPEPILLANPASEVVPSTWQPKRNQFLRWWHRHNWPDIGGCLDLKGC